MTNEPELMPEEIYANDAGKLRSNFDGMPKGGNWSVFPVHVKGPRGKPCQAIQKYSRTKYIRADLSQPINGDTSDGYHTFNELYEHRHALFLAVLKCYPDKAWKSLYHDDLTMFKGWFIAGIETPDGQATYHIPMRLWEGFHVKILDTAPKWDGHTPADVVKRISALTREVERDEKQC